MLASGAMRAALERADAWVRPAAASASSATWAPRLLGLALTALVAAAVFAGGGSSDERIAWIGGGALAIALGAAAASLAGQLPRPRPGLATVAAVALLALFVTWNGATILWSVAPDRSWDYFNRGLVYLGFLVAGLFAGAVVPRAVSRAGAALALVIAGALAWALAGKFVPALYPDGERIARLRAPVEYWNALALMLAIGLVLALWLAGERKRRPSSRALAVVFSYGALVGMFLTYSRGGIAVALLAVAAWLALDSARLASLAALALSLPPAIGVTVWAFGQAGVTADRTAYATRAEDGREFALVFFAGAALVYGAAYAIARSASRRTSEELQFRIPRGAVAAVAVGAAVAASALVVATSDPVAWLQAQANEFKNPPTVLLTQEPSRLGSVSSNNRWTWWQEAWRAFEEEPIMGTGAGSFETTHRLLRENSLSVTAPHNVGLQFLSETGIVGAGLAGGAVAAALAGLATAARRLRDGERRAAQALALGVAAYIVHSLVDWNWDFVAISAPAFATTGLILGASGGRAEPRRSGRVGLAACALVLPAALLSLFAPWAAERRVEQTYSALVRGDEDEAARLAREGARLNPLAVDPLLARADAETVRGDTGAARTALVRAVELHPENPDTWYALGSFEYEIAGRADAARRYARVAAKLDPFGPAASLLAELEAADAAP